MMMVVTAVTMAEVAAAASSFPQDPDVPVLPSGTGTTLVGSDWDFAEQCRALMNSKAYGGGEDEEK